MDREVCDLLLPRSFWARQLAPLPSCSFLLFSSPSADVSRATHVKRSLVFTGLNLGYVAMGTSEWRPVLKRGGLNEKRNPARSYELFIGREDMTSGGRDWS